MRTDGNTANTVHDADGGDLRRLPLRSLDLVIVRVVEREQRLRDSANIVYV